MMDAWIGAGAVVVGVLITGIVTYLLQKWSDDRRWQREDALHRQAEEKEDELRKQVQEREDSTRFISEKAKIYAGLLDIPTKLLMTLPDHYKSDSEPDYVLMKELSIEIANLNTMASVYSSISRETRSSINNFTEVSLEFLTQIELAGKASQLSDDKAFELLEPVVEAHTDLLVTAKKELNLFTESQ